MGSPNIKDALVKEIAEELECGMICYVHKHTFELLYVPDDLELADDTGAWDDTLKKVEDDRASYYKFEKMDSRRGFRVMEDFANQIVDRNFQERLFFALSNRKPFANFKALVETSRWREDWFSFRLNAGIAWVKEQLDVQD